MINRVEPLRLLLQTLLPLGELLLVFGPAPRLRLDEELAQAGDRAAVPIRYARSYPHQLRRGDGPLDAERRASAGYGCIEDTLNALETAVSGKVINVAKDSGLPEVKAIRRAVHYRLKQGGLDRLAQIFGRDNTYVELQNAGLEVQQRVNPELVKLAAEAKLPLVATEPLATLGCDERSPVRTRSPSAEASSEETSGARHQACRRSRSKTRMSSSWPANGAHAATALPDPSSGWL